MRISARFEFKWQDLWIGVYPKGWYRAYVEDSYPRHYQDTGNPYDFLDIWICIVPCFPLHIELRRKV